MRTRTACTFFCGLTAAAGAAALVLAPSSIEAQTPAPLDAPKPTPAETAFKNEIRPLLMQHCGKCHGPDEMKSGIRVDLLDAAFRDQHLGLWRDIAGQLEDEAMPPEGKPQPTAAQREKLVQWIHAGIKAAQLRSQERNGWSRRLTVPQYRNTLRDLLGLEEDLSKVLPGDGQSKDGFANDGASLQLSPMQMEYYLDIAGHALDLCMVDPAKPPVIQDFRLDFGRGIRPNPLREHLVLGAGSHLLNNADFTINEPAPAKPFPFTPLRMQREFDFIEGYAGNDTVRGMRHFSGLEHAVFACMRGTEGYPGGAAAYSMAPDALLLRPAIPSSELFGQGNTMGPMANFKISVRELPSGGLFRVKVVASRFENDGLPLNPDTDPPEGVPGIRASFKDGRAALTVPEAGVYQVDLEHRPGGEGGQLELLLDGRPYAFQAQGGKKDAKKDGKSVRRKAANEIDIDGIAAFQFDAVTVTVPGHARMINLHEFQLISGERNLAPQAEVSSSSVYSGGDQFAFKHLVDGDFDNLAHSAEEDNPWFRLAFKAPQTIDAIRIWNRAGFESRFNGAEAVFTLAGKEVHRRKLVPDEEDREDALMLVRLDKGPLSVESRQGKAPLSVILHRLPDGSREARDYEAFAHRSPQLGVRIGFRRDCGSTLTPVAPPQPVAAGKPSEFVFLGAINNYPSTAQVEKNPNYIAGMREIGVRSEYTDGRPMPRLCIHSVEFEGPYLEQWPPPPHKAIFIDSPNRNDPPRYAGEILESFMKRAYRRQPTASETALVRRVWAQRFRESGDFRASVKDALLVVLTSPQFLFISESSATPAPEPLAPHELAAKLSYFLWNTMPDARLRAAADGGTLQGSLDAEVDRMLDDPRSAQFFDAFATQWLALDKFDVVEVDRKLFPKMDRDTRAQLRREPAEFLRLLVAQNLPARNLIESDFIAANDVVAAYYGLADKSESGLAFHAIPVGKSGRGGLLTQAAILCGLSSGKESNPVKRGAWLARKIVAEPPADPPPNVPTLKEDPAAKLTLRQRLERHRNQPGCAKCHEKIDPWGVPLEEFDAVGMRKNAKGLDASSDLPDDTHVAGFEELRKYLADDRADQVAYAFMKHLATYALGRSLSYFEQDELKKQCLAMKPGGYKTRDMIHWLVKSDLFLKK